MLRLDTFIVAEFVSMLNFFYEKCWDTGLVTPTFIIEPIFCFFVNESDSGILHAPLVFKQHKIESEPIKAGEGDGLL